MGSLSFSFALTSISSTTSYPLLRTSAWPSDCLLPLTLAHNPAAYPTLVPQHASAYLQYIHDSTAESISRHLQSTAIEPLEARVRQLGSELASTRGELAELQEQVGEGGRV